MFGIGDNKKLNSDDPAMLDSVRQLTDDDEQSSAPAAVATPAEGFSSGPVVATSPSASTQVQDVISSTVKPSLVAPPISISPTDSTSSSNSSISSFATDNATTTPSIFSSVPVTQPQKTDDPTGAPPVDPVSSFDTEGSGEDVKKDDQSYNPSSLESPAQETTISKFGSSDVSPDKVEGDASSDSSDSTGDHIINHDHLSGMKQQALTHLESIVEHLEQTPEETFKTTMMMIQANDNHTLLDKALNAAKEIKDDKARAQAMLDIVNEINYFSQQK